VWSGPSETIPATTIKGPLLAERPAYPCQMRVLPADGRDHKERQNARLADARHARRTEDRSSMPVTGTSHHLTMSKQQGLPHARERREPRNAWWAWADLNGRPHAYQACALTS
jgi:hypothetical protein